MYLEACLPPGYRWSAVEHGRVHHGTPEQRAREWQRLKAQGVQTGLMDLFILGPRRFFAWVELKVGKNTTSDAQDVWGDFVMQAGHHWWLVRHVVDLHDLLADCGLPLTPLHREIALGHDRALEVERPAAKARAKPRKAKPTARAIAAYHRGLGI